MASLYKWNAPLHLDCVLFYEDNMVICGAYEYFEGEKRRKGALYYLDHSGTLLTSTETLPFLNTDLSGITDIRNGANEILISCSNGSIYKSKKMGLFEKLFDIEDPCTLMSSTLINSSQRPALAAAADNGYIYYQDKMTGSFDLKWKAHNAAIWWITSNKAGDMLWTASDDNNIMEFNLEKIQADIAKYSVCIGQCDAGVCCIEPFKTTDNLILSGSYDKTIRIFDKRVSKEAQCMIKLDSGVWRVRFSNFDDNLFTASAMYDGAYLFDLRNLITNNSMVTPSMVLGHLKTDSIVYGSDIIQNKNGDLLLCSVTFYDNCLHYWTI